MRIPDYPKTQELASNDTFILDGDQGTQGILAQDLATALMQLQGTQNLLSHIDLSELETVEGNKLNALTDSILIGKSQTISKIGMFDSIYSIINGSGNRNNTMNRKAFSGDRNLGSYVSDEQYATIKDGSFHDMFLGDYWLINEIGWRIVDFDYWYGKARDDTSWVHHVVLMPDSVLTLSKYNDTDTSTGGYVGSKIYKEGLEEAYRIVCQSFPALKLYNHKVDLVNSIYNGVASGGGWFFRTLDLPTEAMIYGSSIQRLTNSSGNLIYQDTVDMNQLSLMRINPRSQSIASKGFWLRDILSNTFGAIVTNAGESSKTLLSTEMGVRPVFGIMG